VDTGTARFRTFRGANHELFHAWPRAADFLPAIAGFRPGDTPRYLPLFERMRERRDYVSDGCQFTLRQASTAALRRSTTSARLRTKAVTMYREQLDRRRGRRARDAPACCPGHRPMTAAATEATLPLEEVV